jgi:hypothetical protein
MDGCVTTSSSAAAVTEPVRTTARKLRSCVNVIDKAARIIEETLMVRTYLLLAFKSSSGMLPS